MVLAPADERLPYAEQLMKEGYAETLAISVPRPEDGGQPAFDPCAARRPYKTVCFRPKPVTTQGEARALQHLAREHGWETVNVITAQSHVTRARMLMSRCFDGDIRMLAAGKERPIFSTTRIGSSWAYVYLYETAALTKAATRQSC